MNVKKAENTATAALVQNLRDAISTKDSLIESLKKDITANEEQTKKVFFKFRCVFIKIYEWAFSSQKRRVLIKSIENAEFQGVGQSAYHLFRLENVQAQVIYTLASVPSKD